MDRLERLFGIQQHWSRSPTPSPPLSPAKTRSSTATTHRSSLQSVEIEMTSIPSSSAATSRTVSAVSTAAAAAAAPAKRHRTVKSAALSGRARPDSHLSQTSSVYKTAKQREEDLNYVIEIREKNRRLAWFQVALAYLLSNIGLFVANILFAVFGNYFLASSLSLVKQY